MFCSELKQTIFHMAAGKGMQGKTPFREKKTGKHKTGRPMGIQKDKEETV